MTKLAHGMSAPTPDNVARVSYYADEAARLMELAKAEPDGKLEACLRRAAWSAIDLAYFWQRADAPRGIPLPPHIMGAKQ